MSSRPEPTFWNPVSTLLLSAKWVPLYPMVSASIVCISEYTFVMEINKWFFFLLQFLYETILILFPQASMRILTGHWPLPLYPCPSFCPSASSCYATVLESTFFPWINLIKQWSFFNVFITYDAISLLKAPGDFLAQHTGSFCNIQTNDEWKQWPSGILHDDRKYGYGFTCTLDSMFFVFQTPGGNLYTPVPEPIDACKVRLVSENFINQYTSWQAKLQADVMSKPNQLVCLHVGMRRGLCLAWPLSWSGRQGVHFLIFNLIFFLLAQTAAVRFKYSLL